MKKYKDIFGNHRFPVTIENQYSVEQAMNSVVLLMEDSDGLSLANAFNNDFQSRRDEGYSMVPDHWYHDTSTGEHMNRVVQGALHIGCLLRWKAEDKNEFTLEDAGYLRVGKPEGLEYFIRLLVLSAMGHDMGKTDVWNPEPGPPWFRNHEKRSFEIMVSMGFPEDHPAAIVVKTHGWCQNVHNAKEKTFTKFLKNFGERSYENNHWTSPPDQKGNFLTANEFRFLYICMLLADCEGFSPKGREAGREQCRVFIKQALPESLPVVDYLIKSLDVLRLNQEEEEEAPVNVGS